jgi:hypothetical protein
VRKKALHSRDNLPSDAITSTSTVALETLCKLPYRLQNLIVSSQDDPVVLSDKVVQYRRLLTHLLRARF